MLSESLTSPKLKGCTNTLTLYDVFIAIWWCHPVIESLQHSIEKNEKIWFLEIWPLTLSAEIEGQGHSVVKFEENKLTLHYKIVANIKFVCLFLQIFKFSVTLTQFWPKLNQPFSVSTITQNWKIISSKLWMLEF